MDWCRPNLIRIGTGLANKTTSDLRVLFGHYRIDDVVRLTLFSKRLEWPRGHLGKAT
jgi:hypothetical protein